MLRIFKSGRFVALFPSPTHIIYNQRAEVIFIVLHVAVTDKRTQYLLEILNERGHDARRYERSLEPKALCVSPSEPPDRLMCRAEELSSGSTLIGGQNAQSVTAYAQSRGVRYINIAGEESFAIQNAVPTAEGALMLIIRDTERTLRGMKLAITGFGRISRALAPMLYALGAKVSVFARSDTDLARASMFDAHKLHQLELLAPSYDVIVNTIPARILANECIASLKPGALLVELASSPYGFDSKYAREAGVLCVEAPGLPSVCAPYSAAGYLADAILAKLEVNHDV